MKISRVEAKKKNKNIYIQKLQLDVAGLQKLGIFNTKKQQRSKGQRNYINSFQMHQSLLQRVKLCLYYSWMQMQ